MTIPYTIDKYHLKNNDCKYVARVQSRSTAETDEIVDHILARGSTLTRSDVIAVLSLMRDVCIDPDPGRPAYRAHEHPSLDRPLAREEYTAALKLAQKYGLKRLDQRRRVAWLEF
ncbi:MAG: hypothetical protein MAG451_00131 [Anaerolineales bacterium]|nr:hypothetical protein [Anaerolineales bacterium]